MWTTVMKSTRAESGTTTDDGKVVLINGQVWRGDVWFANGLTHVRQPDGRVRAFGPRAVYSIEFGATEAMKAAA
jgi:hypothetical protein